MSLITASELHDAPPPALLDVRWELSPRPPRPPGRELYLEGTSRAPRSSTLMIRSPGRPGSAAATRFRAPRRSRAPCGRRACLRIGAWSSTTPATRLPQPGRGGCSGTSGTRDVHVLDGGFSGWLAAGFAIEREVTAVEPGDFVARAGGMPLLDAAAAASLARTGVLLDARAPERFRGEAEPIDPVAGHIPGAVNLPAPELVGGSGRFLARRRAA